MIVGVGIDVVENKRFVDKNQEALSNRILSLEEKKTYLSINDEQVKLEFLASRFAAKEALYKAFSNLQIKNFTDVSVLHDESGKPFFSFEGFEDYRIFLSISHEKSISVAYVIVEK